MLRSSRKSTFRFTACRGLCIAAGALTALALTGCNKKDDVENLEPVSIGQYVDDGAVRATDGDALAYDPTPAPDVQLQQDIGDMVPGADVKVGQEAKFNSAPVVSNGRGADADYIDKADVYWKLNWLRKALLGGDVPPKFAAAVAKAKKALFLTQRDSNFEVAFTAIQHLEAGLQHRQAEKTLEAANLTHSAIPWGAGSDAVRRFISLGGLGFGGRKPLTVETPKAATKLDDTAADLMNDPVATSPERSSLTSQQRAAIDVIQQYESQFHAPPEREMKEEWRLAIQSINELRDNLGLMNRKENSDGDGSEPGPDDSPSVASEPAPPRTSGRGVDGVVDIPQTDGSGVTDLTKPVASTRPEEPEPPDTP